MLKTTIVSFSLMIFTALSACAGGNAESEDTDIAMKSVKGLKALQLELKSAIDSQIGEANCGKDDDCKVLPIGANPCGGPESYAAYSLVETDVETLKTLAEKYKAVRKALNAKTGAVGACIVIPEPQVQCKNRHCKTIPKTGAIVF